MPGHGDAVNGEGRAQEGARQPPHARLEDQNESYRNEKYMAGADVREVARVEEGAEQLQAPVLAEEVDPGLGAGPAPDSDCSWLFRPRTRSRTKKAAR